MKYGCSECKGNACSELGMRRWWWCVAEVGVVCWPVFYETVIAWVGCMLGKSDSLGCRVRVACLRSWSHLFPSLESLACGVRVACLPSQSCCLQSWSRLQSLQHWSSLFIELESLFCRVEVACLQSWSRLLAESLFVESESLACEVGVTAVSLVCQGNGIGNKEGL